MSDTIYEPHHTPAADRDDRLLAGLNYALFLIGNIVGVSTLVGVVIAYARRDSAPHWLQSHYTYQIMTFWTTLVALVACALLVASVILSPVGLIGFALVWLWILLRAIVGLVRLVDGRGHPDPHGLWV